jgi:histidine triad (HIT) family protein
MTLDATYDGENIFAKIIAEEIPSVKIWETDDILAFMDAFPQSEGHCLVIHKVARATNLLDIGDSELSALIRAVKKTTTAVKASLKPDGIRIAQFNGAAAGQSVFHLHFHIIPVYENAALGRHGENGPAPADRLEPLAARIRAAL